MRWREETRRGPLVIAAATLKAVVNEAICRGDGFTAEIAHEDLVDVEWRLRQSERGAR